MQVTSHQSAWVLKGLKDFKMDTLWRKTQTTCIAKQWWLEHPRVAKKCPRIWRANTFHQFLMCRVRMYHKRIFTLNKIRCRILYKNRCENRTSWAIFYQMIKTLSTVSLNWRWLMKTQTELCMCVHVGVHMCSYTIISELYG